MTHILPDAIRSSYHHSEDTLDVHRILLESGYTEKMDLLKKDNSELRRANDQLEKRLSFANREISRLEVFTTVSCIMFGIGFPLCDEGIKC